MIKTDYYAKEFLSNYLQQLNNIEDAEREIKTLKRDYKTHYNVDVDKLIEMVKEIK